MVPTPCTQKTSTLNPHNGRLLEMKGLLDNTTSQRKLFGVLGVLSMLLINMPAAHGAPPKYQLHEDARFESVWVEQDVRVDGKKGMRIHAKFVVKNSLNVSCKLIAMFYTRDGAFLKADGQSDYTTPEGHVSTYVNVKPSFSSTRYADKRLFIPYEAFNIKTSGMYLLKFVLFVERNVHGKEFETIGHSADFNFTYAVQKPQ
jgi:hypothetical protein